MKIVRKLGITFAAAAVGFGLLATTAPAHADSVSAGTSSGTTASSATAGSAGVTADDITWGTGKKTML